MSSHSPAPNELTLDQLRSFIVAAWTYMRRENPAFTDLPAEADPILSLARLEKQVSTSRLKQAVIQAAKDLIALFKQMPAEHIARLEKHLSAEGAPSLARMLDNTQSRIDAILQRGKIRSVREFYLLRDYLDGEGNAGLSSDAKKAAHSMLEEFKNRPLD
ncbi:MAG: hypothetical protein AAFP70_17430 [Calditrichota bacterium]